MTPDGNTKVLLDDTTNQETVGIASLRYDAPKKHCVSGAIGTVQLGIIVAMTQLPLLQQHNPVQSTYPDNCTISDNRVGGFSL